MSITPRTDAARPPYTELQEFVSAEFARTLERELNAANERIKRLESVTSDPHALWANWLRGSVALPVGIGDVREHQDRIKMLENLQLQEEHLSEIERENERLKDQNKRQNELIDSLREMYSKGRPSCEL